MKKISLALTAILAALLLIGHAALWAAKPPKTWGAAEFVAAIERNFHRPVAGSLTKSYDETVNLSLNPQETAERLKDSFDGEATPLPRTRPSKKGSREIATLTRKAGRLFNGRPGEFTIEPLTGQYGLNQPRVSLKIRRYKFLPNILITMKERDIEHSFNLQTRTRKTPRLLSFWQHFATAPKYPPFLKGDVLLKTYYHENLGTFLISNNEVQISPSNGATGTEKLVIPLRGIIRPLAGQAERAARIALRILKSVRR
ncbi:MAG: hypothetical protein HY401_08010 [Elusimicrobia bacterium]|nr:hypothetical protein [Elusimicrobiota bacterium]